jgi:putative phage-type endonuclease
MLTKEQVEERRGFITGSDCSVVLGVNPYESIVNLWRTKLGLAEPKDLSDNPRVQAGNYLEPIVRQMFTDKLGKHVHLPEGLIIHKDHKWMAGNLDGFITEENAILEIKTAAYGEGWGEQGINIIPKHYLCQVAHYMAVADAAFAYVAVLIGGWDFRYYVIDRSSALEAVIIQKEQAFWENNVLGLVEPEPRNLEDVVSMYRNRSIVDPVVAHPGIEEACKDLNATKSQMKVLMKDEAKIKEKIAMFMREHQTLTNPQQEPLLTFKYNKDGEKFNTKKFAKEHPELYKEYLETNPGNRVMKLIGSNDD